MLHLTWSSLVPVNTNSNAPICLDVDGRKKADPLNLELHA